MTDSTATEPTAATPTPTTLATADRYLQPDWFTQHVFNPVVAGLTRIGISVWGSRVLEVPGRTTGEIRATPVNLLTLDGHQYLVAPRGETQWVKNVRAAGGCRLRVGRRVSEVRMTELPDADKPSILRPYLQRWKFEVGRFFEGLDAASDEEMLAAAGRYPVFLVTALADGRPVPARAATGGLSTRFDPHSQHYPRQHERVASNERAGRDGNGR